MNITFEEGRIYFNVDKEYRPKLGKMRLEIRPKVRYVKDELEVEWEIQRYEETKLSIGPRESVMVDREGKVMSKCDYYNYFDDTWLILPGPRHLILHHL